MGLTPPWHPSAGSAEVSAPLASDGGAVQLAGPIAVCGFALPFEEDGKVLECNFLSGIHSCLTGLWEADPRGRGLGILGVPRSYPFSWFC